MQKGFAHLLTPKRHPDIHGPHKHSIRISSYNTSWDQDVPQNGLHQNHDILRLGCLGKVGTWMEDDSCCFSFFGWFGFGGRSCSSFLTTTVARRSNVRNAMGNLPAVRQIIQGDQVDQVQGVKKALRTCCLLFRRIWAYHIQIRGNAFLTKIEIPREPKQHRKKQTKQSRLPCDKNWLCRPREKVRQVGLDL